MDRKNYIQAVNKYIDIGAEKLLTLLSKECSTSNCNVIC